MNDLNFALLALLILVLFLFFRMQRLLHKMSTRLERMQDLVWKVERGTKKLEKEIKP